MDLSILIATVPPRRKYLNRLLANLQNQIVKNNLQDKIEVIIYEDDFENVIGYKKNKLYESAKGKYVVSIDDDDDVSEDYCASIIEVIENNDVDQISFTHAYYHNNRENWIPITISKENRYYHANFFNIVDFFITRYHKERGTDYELHIEGVPILKTKENNFFKMVLLYLFFKVSHKKLVRCTRYSCHTVVLRKEIAQSVKFTDRLKEEDIEWATEIYKQGLIKTEYIIDKVLYHYFYDHDMSIDRGKQGRLTIEEKREVLTNNLNTIKDIDWIIQPIDKINIRWI